MSAEKPGKLPKAPGKGIANLRRGGGRPVGVPNKVTTEFRDTVRALLESNAQNVGIWLGQVASGHGDVKPAPEKALDLLARLAEFAAPKLARTEVTGVDGGPMTTVTRIELVPMSGNRTS